MLTRKEVEDSPTGITYVTKGLCREHIAQLASELESLLSNRGEVVLTDDEYRAYTKSKIEELEASISELYDGMNKLYDMVRGGT